MRKILFIFILSRLVGEGKVNFLQIKKELEIGLEPTTY